MALIVSNSDSANPQQVKMKADKVKKNLQEFHRSGGNPVPYMQRMEEVRRYIQGGDFNKAEMLLDQILSDLAENASSKGSALVARPYQKPDRYKKVNKEWKNPQKIEIIGYDKDAMEVGISKDQTLMFFNDRQKPNKDLHWAERIDDDIFQYMGKMKNVNTYTVDASPVMDDNGNIYYTSTYNHDTLKNNGIYTSMYVGKFVDGGVRYPQPLTGDIYVEEKKWFSLDTDVSPDGDTIYFSQGRFNTQPPSIFNVVVAQRVSGNEYKVKEGILDNVNTDDGLEYAPSISADGRELFFTKLKKVGGKPKFAGIYVAKRDSTSEPFGIPEKIEAITGVVEAPTITEDSK